MFLLLTGLLFAGTGCSSTESITTEYNAEEDRTHFETDPIRITRGGSGLGSSGEQIIYVKSTANCDGEACTPDQVRILLSSGTRNVSWLEYDDVTINADNWSRTWGNVSTREDPELIGIGEFMRLTLPLDEFRTLLQSRGMSIEIGGMSIDLSFDQMQRFRDMMIAMDPERYDQPDDVLNDDAAEEDDFV
ncbi:hypothetical protein [Longimonas sp.]|uniref:hypothetical protein n=1 Tax=Longimonas sp. TaxID=2039626 RepID=UPI0039760389